MPLGALPARFRRERVLLIGCGDVGLRVANQLGGRVRLLALTSSPDRVPALRAQGLAVLQGDLDEPASIVRLAGLATRVVHLAPPPGEGEDDPRTTALLRALRLRTAPASLVYGSTTGVYGDCGGAKISESHPVAPRTARAQRRVDAERTVRFFGRSASVRAGILRIPGIYAPDREGGTPRERLRRGTPVLRPEDDVFTSHIHADDLARALVAALWRGRAQRVVNAVDDTELKMGDWFDFAADFYGLRRPPRVSREEARHTLPPTLLSFMGESRRLRNDRLKRELRVRLRYATVADGLRAG